MSGKLIIFSAPSGSGKSTMINYLLKQGLRLAFSISATSRPPRGTEQHGVEYFFLSPEEFRKRIENDEFLEYEEVYTDRFYGTLKAQRCITITGNTTLSETHNGAVLNVTNTCNITVPTGLDINFQCVIFAKGSIVVTFVSSGVTIYAPSGLLLKKDKMASLICTATNNFNLTGELATS